MKMTSLLMALLLLLPFASFAQEAQGAEPFYRNPSKIKDIGDPFILEAEGAYWHFSTTGGIAYQVRRSTDLVTWEKPVWAYAPGPGSWGDRDFWAPEVFRYKDAYYMVYSARWKQNGSLRIGIARAEAPGGPYEDITQGPLFDFGYAVIDGHLLFEDGKNYLYYARDCSENIVSGRHESHVYGIRINETLDKVEGEPVLLTRPDQPWEMASGPEWLWNEGPSVLKQGGKYWLFYSANYYAGKEYGVGAAWSDEPLGLYRKLDTNPQLSCVEEDGKVIVSGPGHNSFFNVGEELFTAYHSHVTPGSPSGYRQMNFDRAGFDAQGLPFINGPTLEETLKPLAQLGLHNHLQRAKAQGEALLLTDGDQGMGSAAKQGRYAAIPRYDFTWDEPVRIDGLMLYADAEQAARGRFILGEKDIPFTLEPGDVTLGRSLMLRFDSLSCDSLSLVWDGAPPHVYELLAIGS